MILFFTMSFASLVLILCLSELVGIVPFAGGNFGFVRCSLGPFWGFLAASLEFLYYNMYNARSLLKIATLVEASHDFNPDWNPLWAFLGMVFVLMVNVRGGLTFWGLMMLITLFTLAILMIFYVGAYSNLDFYGYVYARNYPKRFHNDGTIGNGFRYMSSTTRVVVFYLGLDILPLCSLRVKDESRVIPRALLTSFFVVFCISILAVFGVACHYPGIHPLLARTSFVLQYGLADAVTMDPKRYPLLLMPPTVASTIGYLYAAGNQLAAMAESGLMPKFLRPRVGSDQIPVVALVTCGIIQFLIYYFIHKYEPLIVIFAANMWSLAAPGLFMFVCAAFIAFRVKFSSMKRNFVSPLGIPGAVYGVIAWLHIVVINSERHIQTNRKATKAFYIYMSIMIVYYFVYVQFVQFFSKEEQEKFMKAYVLNANQMRKKNGYYSYMAGMWRRTSEVTAYLGFGSNSRHTTGAVSGVSAGTLRDKQNSKMAAASALASTRFAFGSNKVEAEPFKPNSVKLTSNPPERKASLRASLTNGSVKVGWSGKVMSENDSRRVFNLLNPNVVEEIANHDEAVEEDSQNAPIPGETLLEEYPEHFVPVLVTEDTNGEAKRANDEEQGLQMVQTRGAELA